MLTSLAVLLRILVNPLANVFQKKLTDRGTNPFLLSFASYFWLSVLSLPFAAAVDWSVYPAEFWANALGVGLLGAVGNGFLVLALKYGELSVLGPINAYKSVVGILLGMLLLAEMPDLCGVLGVGLILAGSYFVLGSGTESFSWSLLWRADVRFRFLAMFCGAAEAVFIKKVIQLSSPEISLMIWFGFGAVFSIPFLGIIRLMTKRDRIFGENNLAETTSLFPPFAKLALYAGMVFCVGLMQLTTNYVFEKMPVGYALALFQLSAVVSVLFGYRFFQERGFARKMLGSLIMIAGSALIILF